MNRPPIPTVQSLVVSIKARLESIDTSLPLTQRDLEIIELKARDYKHKYHNFYAFLKDLDLDVAYKLIILILNKNDKITSLLTNEQRRLGCENSGADINLVRYIGDDGEISKIGFYVYKSMKVECWDLSIEALWFEESITTFIRKINQMFNNRSITSRMVRVEA